MLVDGVQATMRCSCSTATAASARWNAGAKRVLGYAAERCIGRDVSPLLPAATTATAAADRGAGARAAEGGTYRAEGWRLRKPMAPRSGPRSSTTAARRRRRRPRGFVQIVARPHRAAARRGAGERGPAHRRVHRDAVARAAQPAGADPQRGGGAAARSADAPEAEWCAERDRPAGRAHDAAGGRPARRQPHHQRQDPARARAAGSQCAWSRRPSTRCAARCGRAAATRWRCELAPQPLHGGRRRDAPDPGAGQPAEQRGEVHAGRADASQVDAWSSDGAAACVQVQRQRRRHARNRCCAMRSSPSCRATRALDRAEGGLGIGLTLVQDASSSCTAAPWPPRAPDPGRAATFTVSLPLPRDGAQAAAAPAPAARPSGRPTERADRRRQPRLGRQPGDAAARSRATRCAWPTTAPRRCVLAERVEPRRGAARHRPAGDGRLRGRAAAARAPGAGTASRLIAVTGYGQERRPRAARGRRLRRTT